LFSRSGCTLPGAVPLPGQRARLYIESGESQENRKKFIAGSFPTFSPPSPVTHSGRHSQRRAAFCRLWVPRWADTTNTTRPKTLPSGKQRSGSGCLSAGGIRSPVSLDMASTSSAQIRCGCKQPPVIGGSQRLETWLLAHPPQNEHPALGAAHSEPARSSSNPHSCLTAFHGPLCAHALPTARDTAYRAG
jgi:hypothetical protein